MTRFKLDHVEHYNKPGTFIILLEFLLPIFKESGSGYFAETVDFLVDLKAVHSEQDVDTIMSNLIVSVVGKAPFCHWFDNEVEKWVNYSRNYGTKRSGKSTTSSIARGTGNIDIFRAVRQNADIQFSTAASGFSSHGPLIKDNFTFLYSINIFI